MQTLKAGASAPLANDHVTVTVSHPAEPELYVLAFELTAAGKVRGDGDLVFAGKPSSADNSLSWQSKNGPGGQSQQVFTLSGTPAGIARVAFAISVADEADHTLDEAEGLSVTVEAGGSAYDLSPKVGQLYLKTRSLAFQLNLSGGTPTVESIWRGSSDGDATKFGPEFGISLSEGDEPAQAAPAAPPARQAAPAAAPRPRTTNSAAYQNARPGVRRAANAGVDTLQQRLSGRAGAPPRGRVPSAEQAPAIVSQSAQHFQRTAQQRRPAYGQARCANQYVPGTPFSGRVWQGNYPGVSYGYWPSYGSYGYWDPYADRFVAVMLAESLGAGLVYDFGLYGGYDPFFDYGYGYGTLPWLDPWARGDWNLDGIPDYMETMYGGMSDWNFDGIPDVYETAVIDPFMPYDPLAFGVVGGIELGMEMAEVNQLEAENQMLEAQNADLMAGQMGADQQFAMDQQGFVPDDSFGGAVPDEYSFQDDPNAGYDPNQGYPDTQGADPDQGWSGDPQGADPGQGQWADPDQADPDQQWGGDPNQGQQDWNQPADNGGGWSPDPEPDGNDTSFGSGDDNNWG